MVAAQLALFPYASERLLWKEPLPDQIRRRVRILLIKIAVEKDPGVLYRHILFMDVDHFKRVNDTHGHVAGDAVLRFIARTFIANARPFDLYGRWGGEEFIGIIRNVTSEELAQVGERLRLLIEHSYVMQGAERIQVTISVGATTVREADTIDTLVKRTDALLYQSKSAGRNRLTLG